VITEDAPPPSNVGARVVSGSVWVLVGFGANALVNLARTVILARALSVDAYGLAAAVLVVSRLLGGVGSMGLQVAAVQMKREPDDDVLNTVWTLDRLFVKLLSGALLFAFAPLVAGFFGSPDLAGPLRGLALFPVAMAFENNAMVVLSRRLEMRRRIQLDLSSALGGAVVIPAALVWPSVWVVVVSLVAGRLTRTVASYVVYPKLPRVRFSRAAFLELFPFGRFVFLQNLLMIVRDQIDKLLIAALIGTASLGVFELGQRLGAQVIAVVDNIALKVLFPVFARTQSDAELGAHRYLTTVEVLSIIVLPTSALLALGADAITPLLFGPGWEDAVVAVRVLSVAAAVRVLSGASRPLIRGFGRSGVELSMDVALVGSIVALVVWLAPLHGVEGAVYAVLFAYLTQIPLSLACTTICLDVRWRDVIGATSHAALATLLASAAGHLGVELVRARAASTWLELVVLIAAFGSAYVVSLAVLTRRSRSARIDDVITALRDALARLRARPK
jgi:O-antigen/teichoic acid export membrane protein